ncbi:MAG: tRNA (adenosine(37)-N6)-threonylcarbamoyltransferase complex transferase subunit TsaD [Candidatus Berkelbacteria bacterium]|nr:MAG: tRNA (adenosine(37)-N6)-threonylcarbamoyltransferase complex transferase subunit TsaD [Candidatus Berkelbacteria bacterium]QQG51733.1 MAG: tRNA (adenosine(37)-N6)-threonylcarbamoyltransferase complex transferase subunit TsaD [Candidatus Berkelbacteria bacterium]
MRILAIETSCDETAAALIEAQNFQPVIHTNVIASQIDVHAETGGVVPNTAARLHTENLPRVLHEATKAKRLDYDAVAVTVGPGLVGCLLVGMSAAKTIAMAKKLPFFAINHLEGHIYSAWLEQKAPPELPALIIIVSGGHTDLVLMERHLYYQHLGRTRDDAAGEAFDKVARLLGLPYPGGPALSELAIHGDELAFPFPISLNEQDSLEFSFSGLKGAVAHQVAKLPDPLPRHTAADIAASFQKTVSETIKRKMLRALQENPGVKTVCLVGGVAANKHLRHSLEHALNQEQPQIRFVVPDFKYCTDNAAMIGAAAVYHHLFGRADDWASVEADPNLELGIG